MSSPEPLEPVSPLPEVKPFEPAAERAPAVSEERGIVGWARAIAFGIRDTAHDMLEEGRRGAHEAYEEGWRRYDAKTRKRRKP